MSDGQDDDSAVWIQQLVAGDEQVVRQFLTYYGVSLERLAKSRMTPALQKRVGADDIVQSVCRTFFRRAQKNEFQLDESQDLWRLLCAITLTKVRQHARFHFRKRRSLDQEEGLPDDDRRARHGLHALAADAQPTPDEAAEFADQMQRFFDLLDDEERDLVQLRLAGYSQQQIAAELGCSERTVRRLTQRVRHHWEQQLGQMLSG